MNTLCLYAACLLSWAAAAGANQGADEKGGIPQNVPMCSLFSNYNYPGIDWEALNDPQNDVLLRTCLRGATTFDLMALKIADLDARLARLEKGRLVQRSGTDYALRFPVITGARHARLQTAVQAAAKEMVPGVKEMVQEIKTQLQGDEGMLYHFVWSHMMDGNLAWTILEIRLQRILQKSMLDLTTCWWMYPEHLFAVGTNTYGENSGRLTITWRRSTPAPADICGSLCASNEAFLLAIAQKRPIPTDKITDQLRSFGFVDADNHSTLFLLDLSSPLVPVLAQCSSRFVQLATTHLDVKGIAQDLGIAPEQAMVIAYHELCYEILGTLNTAGDLPIPQVSQDNPQSARLLVSYLPIASPAQQSQMEKVFNEMIRKAITEEHSR
jgi:hypothetical protein